MALIKCAECGNDYSEQAKACVHCGARNPNKTSAGTVIGYVIGLGAIIVGGFLAYGCMRLNTDPDAQASATERDAIAYCESEYARLKERQSMDPAALQLASDTCDMMKVDYRHKWNREP